MVYHDDEQSSTNTAQLVQDKTPSLGGDAWHMSIHSWMG